MSEIDTELSLAHHQATHDHLTDLLNRRGLEEKFNELAQSIPGNFCAVCIDLDDLKRVNSAGGHPAGDEYLVRAATVLSNSVRKTGRDEPDIIAAARVGGDEFVVMLLGIDDQGKLDGVIKRIQQDLESNNIPASMGGRVHKEGENFTVLIKDADELADKNKKERKESKI